MIKKKDILGQYYFQNQINAKKIYDEQNIKILNKDQCCAEPYWSPRQKKNEVN